MRVSDLWTSAALNNGIHGLLDRPETPPGVELQEITRVAQEPESLTTSKRRAPVVLGISIYVVSMEEHMPTASGDRALRAVTGIARPRSESRRCFQHAAADCLVKHAEAAAGFITDYGGHRE